MNDGSYFTLDAVAYWLASYFVADFCPIIFSLGWDYHIFGLPKALSGLKTPRDGGVLYTYVVASVPR